MKKIFAISILAVMAVVTSNAWASDTSVKEAYGIGSAADYNIATVQFVNNSFVAKNAGWGNENKILTTDGNQKVTYVDTIDQGQVSGLTDALAGKVDDTQIANADATVPTAKMDTMVPTVQHMANAIADAVSTGVGAVDLSSRVAVDQGTGNANKVMVTGTDGKVTAATTIAQDKVENLTTDLSGKIGKTQVLTSKAQDMNGNNVEADAAANPDAYVATWGAVADKVEAEVDRLEDGFSTDLSGKVDKTSVVSKTKSEEMALGKYASDVQAWFNQTDEANDELVPSINAVATNFIPAVPFSYHTPMNPWWGESNTTVVGEYAPRGHYVLTAEVDSDGNVYYRWIGYDGEDVPGA